MYSSSTNSYRGSVTEQEISKLFRESFCRKNGVGVIECAVSSSCVTSRLTNTQNISLYSIYDIL